MVGLIGELIEWLRTSDDDAEIQEGRVDFGGEDTATCVDYGPSGHDSQPLPGDYAIVVPGPESGSYVIVGWVDPWNQGVAKQGESRLYARDGVDVVGALHVTADGKPPDDPDNLLMELIARADRTDAALNALASEYNAHVHDTTGTVEETSTVGVISKPKKVTLGDASTQSTTHAVGCDKVYVS